MYTECLQQNVKQRQNLNRGVDVNIILKRTFAMLSCVGGLGSSASGTL